MSVERPTLIQVFSCIRLTNTRTRSARLCEGSNIECVSSIRIQSFDQKFDLLTIPSLPFLVFLSGHFGFCFQMRTTILLDLTDTISPVPLDVT